LGLGPEDGILLVLGPLQPVLARGVADGVRLELLAAGVPHAVDLFFGVVEDVGAHDGVPLPRLFGRQDRVVARPLPRPAVLAGGAADPGLALRLPGVPHAVLAALLDDEGAVHVLLPAG